jgi:hypothetical protein
MDVSEGVEDVDCHPTCLCHSYRPPLTARVGACAISLVSCVLGVQRRRVTCLLCPVSLVSRLFVVRNIKGVWYLMGNMKCV